MDDAGPDSDEDFDPGEATIIDVEEDLSEEDEDFEPEEALPKSTSKSTRHRTPRNKESATATTQTPTAAKNTPTAGKRSTIKWKKSYGIDQATIPKMAAFDRRAFGPPAKVTSYTRGMPDFHHSMSRAIQTLYVFGDASEDLKAFYEVKERFFDQVSLPSRRLIRVAGNGNGAFAGLCLSPFHCEERRVREATQGWGWYRDQGKGIFRDRQGIIVSTVSRRLVLENKGPAWNCLLGPANVQEIRQLGPGDIMPLAEPRESAGARSMKSHQGWLLHVGGKVQCLSWVPNRSSNQQLLCIVTAATAEEYTTDNDNRNAFVPHTGFHSTMQIWKIPADNTQVGARPDLKIKPRLRAILSWDWGDLRKMEWCPTPKDARDTDETHLGLMAGIWRDGKMRILDIFLPPASTNEAEEDAVQHIHYPTAAFSVRPPDTVCTCLTWLSSSTIAAAHANGSVGIWSIPRCLSESSLPNFQEGTSPRPFFYRKIHDTYILSLTSGYPSRPHFLITQAVDGTTRLTSILDPSTDQSGTARSRVSVSALAWLDFFQSVLSTDENGSLNYTAVRRFFTKTLVQKLSGLIGDISVSPLHPCALSGCADGSVWAVNPIRRARNLRSDAWAQIWFRHEYRRPVDELVLDESIYDDGAFTKNKNKGPSTLSTAALPALTTQHSTEPLIRITDGYKLSPSSQNSEIKGKGKGGKGKKGDDPTDGLIFSTVHEPLSAVTKISWNPNFKCGTWAAAGMASGLVRVEDLGVD